MFTRQGFWNAFKPRGLLSDSTCLLEAEPGKLDIKRQAAMAVKSTYSVEAYEEVKINVTNAFV